MERRNNLFRNCLFAMVFAVLTFTSCVQGDYELYDDLELVSFTRKTKGWGDPLLSQQGTHNGKAIFYGTECAAFALSYYLSGG